MQLTKQQVEHTAKLARLGLAEKEISKFQKELSAVLNFVKKLNQVKTDKVKPTAHITGLENITRKDRVFISNKNIRKKLLKLSPETQGENVKVKSIL